MNTYLNYIVFILTTIFYYMIKNSDDTSKTDLNGQPQVESSNYMMLFIYFLIVVISQFFINASILTETCGNSFASNLKDAAISTFMPWTLIFGVVILVLLSFPNIKSAFSDFYGYYYVSGPSNNILSNLLDNNTTDPNKFNLIQQLYSNTSILINQMVPSNFDAYWTQLKNLFKNPMDDSKKTELRKLVDTRDNIGEGMWYIYTGILICSLVQLKLSNVSCNRAIIERPIQ
jgi:hypothetical protein